MAVLEVEQTVVDTAAGEARREGEAGRQGGQEGREMTGPGGSEEEPFDE